MTSVAPWSRVCAVLQAQQSHRDLGVLNDRCFNAVHFSLTLFGIYTSLYAQNSNASWLARLKQALDMYTIRKGMKMRCLLNEDAVIIAASFSVSLVDIDVPELFLRGLLSSNVAGMFKQEQTRTTTKQRKQDT